MCYIIKVYMCVYSMRAHNHEATACKSRHQATDPARHPAAGSKKPGPWVIDFNSKQNLLYMYTII